MSSDEAVRHTSEPMLIRTPDQLQQAKRQDAPQPDATVDQQREPREMPERTGILGQLEIEHSHD